MHSLKHGKKKISDHNNGKSPKFLDIQKIALKFRQIGPIAENASKRQNGKHCNP